MSQSERFEVKMLRLPFSFKLPLSFSETIESPDSSISYLLNDVTVEILQDLVISIDLINDGKPNAYIYGRSYTDQEYIY